jgi:hypothetical protein
MSVAVIWWPITMGARVLSQASPMGRAWWIKEHRDRVFLQVLRFSLSAYVTVATYLCVTDVLWYYQLMAV